MIPARTRSLVTAGLLALGLALVPLAGHAATATPVPKLSTWKYLATPVAAPSDWNMLEFSDTAWAAGPGILGYGQPYITTVVPYGPDATHKYRTTYFRNAFTVSDDPATVTLLTLEVNYDDGFVAYINGVEVLRLAMPGGTISYSTLASVSHNGGSYQVIDLSSAIGQLDPGPNVLAVELHQVTDTSADLVLDMELRYETNTARITRGPYLQTGAPDRTTVRWRTNVPTDSKVFYGTAEDDLSTTAELSGSRTEHEIELTSLTADTPYFYTIGASIEVLAGPDSVASFTTAPVAGTSKPTRIWVLGDSGQPGGAPSVRNAYTTYTGERATDLWLMLGDNAYNSGTDAEYQASVFNIFGPTLKSSVLWLTRGNHDGVYAGASNDYYDIFTLPAGAQAGGLPSGSEAYYSFDYGDIHFICLDSEGTDRSIGGAMMRWLREDLAASPRLWNIAFWHHPPYTKGSHDSDNEFDSGGRMRDMRQNALPALDSAGVDLVLTGHSHSYERSFLLRGHYGTSGTLTPEMKVDPGNGRLLEDGAYVKPDGAAGTLDGAVYAVAGSSSQISGGSLNHPVMVTSMNVMGSMVIDVDGGRLDARFLSNTGALLDSFTIVKGVPLAAHPSPPAPALRLALAGLHPGTEEVRLSYSVPAPGPARLAILDAAGRRVATVLDQVVEPGPQVAVWRSRDGRGRLVASGIYFAVLESAGERRVVKIVRSR